MVNVFFMIFVNLSVKEGCLFYSYEIHGTGMLQCLWKALKEECMGFGSVMFGLAAQKFLNIE